MVLILIYVSIMAAKLAADRVASCASSPSFAERRDEDAPSETPDRGRQVDRVAEEMRS